MSNCQDVFREMLPEYARGLLEQNETEGVEEHLKNCTDCASELHIIRQIERQILPEPPPWFFNSLPGKVITEIRVRRRKRMRWMIPAWAGGAAAAVIAILVFLQPGPTPLMEDHVSDYSLVQTQSPLPLGIEEELLSVSGVNIDDLERTLGVELKTVPENSIITMDLIPEGDGYESMGEDTIRFFEDLLENMAPERVRKRVMS